MAKARDKFIKGDICCFSDDAIFENIGRGKNRDNKCVVVGFPNDDNLVNVIWNGSKSKTSYHYSFIEKVTKPSSWGKAQLEWRKNTKDSALDVPNHVSWIYDLEDLVYWDLEDMLGLVVIYDNYDNALMDCPKCNCRTKRRYTSERTIQCSGCNAHISPISYTIFKNSKLPLPIWIKAIWLLKIKQPDISITQLCQTLMCSNKSAINLRKRIAPLNSESLEYKLMMKFKNCCQLWDFRTYFP